MIKYHREKMNKTQDRMALKLDISLPYYQNIERGENIPHHDIIRSMAEVMGMDYIELLLHFEIVTPDDLYWHFKGDK